MKRNTSILGVAALILSVALLSGNAWAGSIEIPVSGMHSVTTIDPGVAWIDDDGVTHVRGLAQIVEPVGEDLDGVPVTGSGVYVMNINIDMATGNGHISVDMSLDAAYGDLMGALRGHADLSITGFVIGGTYNYSRGDDDFEGWHWRGTFSGIYGGLTGQWDGVFHIPGGGGGNKAAATEARTLSAVKGLFR